MKLTENMEIVMEIARKNAINKDPLLNEKLLKREVEVITDNLVLDNLMGISLEFNMCAGIALKHVKDIESYYRILYRRGNDIQMSRYLFLTLDDLNAIDDYINN